MLFGIDGVFRISFNNYQISETVCSVCLIFIMFYGGFGTSFKAAKPVFFRSSLLATVGVLLTAGLTGLFVYAVLKLDLFESFLIGSVIASTDAASVFGILRNKNLNLKDNSASLLEVESGSNDPVSYMLTVVLCTMLRGTYSSRREDYICLVSSADYLFCFTFDWWQWLSQCLSLRCVDGKHSFF